MEFSAAVFLFGGARFHNTDFLSQGWAPPALAVEPVAVPARPALLDNLLDAEEPEVRSRRASPSVVDLFEDKWFGHAAERQSSSSFHDSATSYSPPHRATSRLKEVAKAVVSGLSTQNGSYGKHSSHSKNSQSSQRSKASQGSSRGSPNAEALSPPQPQPGTLLPDEPDTPDWLHERGLSIGEGEDPLAAFGHPSEEQDRLQTLPESRPYPSVASAAPLAAPHRNGVSVKRHSPHQHKELPSASWAHRQKHFHTKNGKESVAAGSSNGAAAASLPTRIPGADTPEGEQLLGANGNPISPTDEQQREAAWRWRFGRRWQMEQAKQLNPAYGNESMDQDTWDEALGYLDACGPGYHLQIARTTSVEAGLAASMFSQGNGSFLLDDSQKEGNLTDTVDLDATKSVTAVARRAQDLLQHQMAIDKTVSQRWDDATAAGSSWAGKYIPAVQIDAQGRFAYVIFRISDRHNAQKLLVRGKSYCSEGQLVQLVNQEVLQASSTYHVPLVTAELIGTGTMEWSRERDRCLNVLEGRMVRKAGTAVQDQADVARLAGALTRCSLPMHYHIIVEGHKLS